MVEMKRQIDLSMQNMEDLPREVIITVNKQNQKLKAQLSKNIKELDLAIKETISCDVTLKIQSKRIESIPGIGPQISANILVTTQAMTLFKNSRQYACYAGVAPFEHTSGSSFRSRTKVHFLANRKIKSLLHMAALNAITYDREIKSYYERKKAEGKNAMSIINAVRFKLIDRIFAVIRREQLYDKNYSSVPYNNNF
jgi:transposase